MKRFYLAVILLLAVSCGRDGLYICVDNSCWETSTETQVGWISFLDSERMSLIQENVEKGAFQIQNGTFTVDGHRVTVNTESQTLHITRTYSHLKNSKNKNYKKLSPHASETVKGSLWAGLKDGDLRFIYIRDGEICLEGNYRNILQKEGLPHGWSWEQNAYTAAGTQLQLGSENAVLYESFLRLDSTIIPHISSAEDMVSMSSLKGTVWAYESKGYPGFIIFTSATDFTRLLVQSELGFLVLTGKYEQKGITVEFKTDAKELNRTCSILNGKFTYLEKTYSRVSF